MTATPAIEGWFTTGFEPALLGSRCTTCSSTYFPPTTGPGGFCRNPACDGESFEEVELSRRGRIWSYTDAQYQPPLPYLAPHAEGEAYVPFALAAVELAEGIVVLGQVAEGFGVADLKVGAEAELVVETLYVDAAEGGTERTIWRWRPVADSHHLPETSTEADA
ncbi:OB-fold domain-containing protein [soil metagenome]